MAKAHPNLPWREFLANHGIAFDPSKDPPVDSGVFATLTAGKRLEGQVDSAPVRGGALQTADAIPHRNAVSASAFYHFRLGPRVQQTIILTNKERVGSNAASLELHLFRWNRLQWIKSITIPAGTIKPMSIPADPGDYAIEVRSWAKTCRHEDKWVGCSAAAFTVLLSQRDAVAR
jgi:hypothetical protein